MKKILFVLCLLSATAAFAQYSNGFASHVSTEPFVYQAPSHPAHASYAPMSQEQSVLGAANYTSARGERPASDFPQAEAVSLGVFAREFRKQHAQAKKARVVWINQ
jgi:hypothetical protein